MYKFRACNEPPLPGQRPFDRSSLSREQQQILERLKVHRRIECEQYLSKHPEIGSLIQSMYEDMFKHQPEDPVMFAAEHFIRQCETKRTSAAPPPQDLASNQAQFFIDTETATMVQLNDNIDELHAERRAQMIVPGADRRESVMQEIAQYRKLNPMNDF